MTWLSDHTQTFLDQRAAQHLLRQRPTVVPADAVRFEVDGQRYLSFCSNDYLGLSQHPALTGAAREATERWGAGAGASHLVSGHQPSHHALEQALAAFTGHERALLFSTGYMANLGVITALLDKDAAVFEDRLNHASLLDAGLFSGARFQRYLHNDMASLERKLAASAAPRKLIVTDGVFSMDGDLAPLPELADLARRYHAVLMVDDAHGLGVLGSSGGGVVDHFDLAAADVPVLVGTLGKAFGSFGAFVAGPATLIEFLIQKARSYIYTTALPPAVAAASLAGLQMIQAEPERRAHLRGRVQQFRQGAQALGLSLMPSATPIQPLLVGDAAKAVAISERLKATGIWVTPIRPPTVAAGSARLRVTLSAAHSEQDVDALLQALALIMQVS